MTVELPRLPDRALLADLCRETAAREVRAAFTREAIRDFYDLDRLFDRKADLASKGFIGLVDAKLAELDAPPMAKQTKSFGFTGKRPSQI